MIGTLWFSGVTLEIQTPTNEDLLIVPGGTGNVGIDVSTDVPDSALQESLALIKEQLLQRNAIPVNDALRVVNKRSLTKEESDINEEPPNFG